MNLTQIKTARDGDEFADDEIRGLQLRVFGEKKVFYLYYRTKSGQRRRPKIGDFPAITLAKARELAREILAKAALGEDLSAERKAARAAETIGQLCDRYLQDYARENKRSASRDEAMLKRYARPRWSSYIATDLTKDEVMALRRAMKDTPVTFNRVRAVLSKMFNFADIEPNPVKRVPRYRETPRKRYLSPDEYIRLAKALDDTEAQYPAAVTLIRLLLLTGARMGEILRTRWDWYADGVLSLPVHKTSESTGAKEILLPPAARAIVDVLPRRNEWLLGIYTRPTVAIDLIFERAKLEGFVLHDIRHSFASEALSAGFTLDQIAELFGHASIQTTRRYAHLIKDRKREAANDIAAQIARRLEARVAV